jgi:UDP-N-acetylmuramoyl-L-alanyl-D-glutamate--2,6-diaminopimelate ligase
MTVQLETLLARLPPDTRVIGDRKRTISSIEIDSRRVREGACFVALRGAHHDGHAFVDRAAAAGAAAVVVEASGDLPERVPATIVRVSDTSRALSTLAAAFFGDPSQAVDVHGVTGTSGKTTTTRMIAAIMNAAGISCAVIGTLGAELRGHTWNLENTTPPAPELQGLLAEMCARGARAVAMEVSSHALALDRVEDVRFRTGVLTNVTRDHLDFHETMEAYASAKHRLFTMCERAVVNVEDAFGAQWEEGVRSRVPTLTYALAARADLVPSSLRLSPAASSFALDGAEFEVPIPGRFNVANALAAIGAARFAGVDDATSARGLASLGTVRGRMERVAGGDVEVIVDYAHKPDALEQALKALREAAPHGLAVVFGCGGDRDRGKRAEMGRIAVRYADRVYVTSDNPRSEDPLAIIREIEAGIGSRPHVVESDRRRAIERAIAEAHRGDVVLVAGKGHETYQIVGERVLPFDDAAVARKALTTRRRSAPLGTGP